MDQITDNNYESILNENKDKFTVVLDFYADWCGPCKIVSTIIENAKDELAAKNAKAFKVDVDNNPEIVSKYNIEALPTILVLDKSTQQEASRTMGIISREDFLKLL